MRQSEAAKVKRIKRINRKLETNSRSGSVMKVRRARSERMKLDVGEYYMVEVYHNVIHQKDVDIDALAKELGV